jgi:hypothetical protein
MRIDTRTGLRPGGALVIALALLLLGAALLTGAASVGSSTMRAEKSHEATLLANAESRVALSEFMASWSVAYDALPVGGSAQQTIGPRQRGPGAALVTTHLRLVRLSPVRFVVALDCQVGPDDAVLARRRLQAIMERSAPPDSMAPPTAPTLINRWSLTDLYD